MVLSLPVSAQEQLPGLAPLFRSNDVLTLRIEADLEQVLDDREEENPEREARIVLTAADGTESAWPAQVRTRGRFRLQSNTCDFPPIRVNFVKGEIEGTVFEDQDKVKLVTHCRDRYESHLVKEFLVYRLYNAITPSSFHVRMARVTWVDTSGENETIERLAFFVEMEEALAERLGGEVIPDSVLADGLHPARVQATEAGRVNLFNYMVGNTDFSLYASTGEGLHNIVPVERTDGRVIPVPYDFDWTGMVDAPYARPDASLGIRRVTDRVYRGLCRADLNYAALFELFQARRAEMTALVENETLLDEGDREDAMDYLGDFWATIESDRNAQRRIEAACRAI